MKTGFYPKLALDGIKKNRCLYFPFILTCIGMIMMFYIISYLYYSDTITAMLGSETVRTMLRLGAITVGIFSCIFLFYTNSFLIRRRKKEFGLYHVLGMGKRNIARILFWETLLTAVISLFVGIGFGILFSKLAELGMVRLMRAQIFYSLQISPDSILFTIIVYGCIFILLFFNTLRQIHFSSAITLVQSDAVGEKPPKGNWFLGILGFICLIIAYYLAVTVADPISALTIFFIAVILVIIGTYLIMIAGSVFFCRLLQKNKHYYYKANHFVSVSSMVYRMKRNGAGLASICILATMVLVMISTTVSLYFGTNDVISIRYPRDINITVSANSFDELGENLTPLQTIISDTLNRDRCTASNITRTRYARFYGYLIQDDFVCDTPLDGDADLTNTTNRKYFCFVPLGDYNQTMGTNETLEDNEAILYTTKDSAYHHNSISFEHGQTYKIKKKLSEFVPGGDTISNIATTFILIVPDVHAAIDTISNQNDLMYLHFVLIYNFDTNLNLDNQISLADDLDIAVSDRFAGSDKIFSDSFDYLIENRAANYETFFADFGGLLYLAIILSIVFLFAAVLIIYYKQISEGYEDQARFEIMQKVGMTKREIRKSINSQLLTIFFLPLVCSGIHLIFAFPMIRKILYLFNLTNLNLFATATLICFAIFALFYTIVYRITSNAYYDIATR